MSKKKIITNLYGQEKEKDYYKQVIEGNFYSNSYIEYESNDDTINQRIPT